MSKRTEWIDKALNELHNVGEMAQMVERRLWESHDDGKAAVVKAHYVASVIELHGRDAKRYLSYAARCKQEDD